MMESCLSHSPQNRGRVEFVFNCLRISGHLPHAQTPRVRAVLCTCTDRPSVNPFWKDDNRLSKLFDGALQKVESQLKNLVHNGKLPPSSVFQIATILDSAKSSETPINSLGLMKLIVALGKIFEEQFDLFMSADGKKGITKHKMHPLKLDSKFMGLIIGKQGRHLASLKKQSGCAVNVKRQGNGQQNDTAIVTISGTQDGIQKACDLLDKQVSEITIKQELHIARVREYNQVRDKIRMARLLVRGKQMQARGVIEDIKTSNRDEYERQQQVSHKLVDEDGFAPVVKRKRNGAKVKGHKLLAEGSRCLNCGESFKGHNLSQSCKHHPGFVVNKRWSCCGRKTLEDQMTTEDHGLTGCVSSLVHNFRPTQKRSGKANLNSRMESTSSLTKEGKDTLRDLK